MWRKSALQGWSNVILGLLLLFSSLASAQFTPFAMWRKRTLTMVNRVLYQSAANSTSQDLTTPAASASNLRVLAIVNNGSATPTVADDAGNTWSTTGATSVISGSSCRTTIFYMKGGNSGSTKITVTFDMNSSPSLWYYEIANANATTPLGPIGTNKSNQSSATSVPAPPAAVTLPSFVVAIACVDQYVQSAAAPFTLDTVQNGNGVAYYFSPGSGSFGATFTQSPSAVWCASTASFN